MSYSPLVRYCFLKPTFCCAKKWGTRPNLKGNAGGLLEQPARFRNRESHASRIGDAPLVQPRAVRLGGAGVENSSRATRSAHGPALSLHLSTQTAGLRRCTSLVEAEYLTQICWQGEIVGAPVQKLWLFRIFVEAWGKMVL